MKIENTLENKSKFFAQYWGQHLIIMGSFLRIIDHVTLCNIENDDILQLKPLHKISDEYIFELTSHLDFDNSEINEFKDLIIRNNNEWYNYFDKQEIIFVYDYLRSKGYALPYMDLSVEDLIEYGWIKLDK